MKMKALLPFIAVCLTGSPSFADWPLPPQRKTLEVENQQLIVRERHDLTDAEKAKAHPGPAGGYLQVLERTRGKLLFTVASPPITYLWISPDSHFIVGMSDIQLDNLFQLVIYDRRGRLLWKQHITPMEARLSDTELDEYRRRFPVAARVSAPWTTRIDATAYVDYERMNAPTALGDGAWSYLFQHRQPSHYSANFSESVTNWVYWYDTDPKPQLEARGDRLSSLSLLDPKGQRFSISLGHRAAGAR